MILNQLTNHVREIVLALRTEPVEVPDFITGILDAFARYETGVMGHSVSIPALLKEQKHTSTTDWTPRTTYRITAS